MTDTTEQLKIAKAQARWLRTMDMEASAECMDALVATIEAILPETGPEDKPFSMTVREAFDRGKAAQKAFSDHAAWHQQRTLVAALTTIGSSDPIQNAYDPDRNRRVAKETITMLENDPTGKAMLTELADDPTIDLDDLISRVDKGPQAELAQLLDQHRRAGGQSERDFALAAGIPYDVARRIAMRRLAEDDLVYLPKIEERFVIPVELKSRLFQSLGAGPRPA